MATIMRETAQAQGAPASPLTRALDVAWRSRSEFQRLAVAVVATVVLVGGIGSAISLGGSDDDLAGAEFASSQSQAAAPTPHEVCVNQLYATVTHLVDGGYALEMQVNGTSDPFYLAAQQMNSTVITDRFQVGDTQALVNLRDASDGVCASSLGDRARANYPTDGTYPE